MKSSQVPPQLARVLYRSMWRAMHGGKYPQALGRVGGAVFGVQHQQESAGGHVALRLPKNASQVRQRFKAWFQQKQQRQPNKFARSTTCKSLDDEALFLLDNPLQAWKHVQNHAAVLPVELTTTTTDALPIVEYGNSAILPGETFEIVMEDDEDMVEQLVEAGQCLIRPCPNSPRAMVVQLTSHYMDLGRTTISCIGGPRVTLHKTENDKDNDARLLLTTARYTVLTDTDKVEDFKQTRVYLLFLLQCALPRQQHHDVTLENSLQTFGLPPLDPEAFSYWMLRHVVSLVHVEERNKWLYRCRSTVARLDYVGQALQDMLDERERQAA